MKNKLLGLVVLLLFAIGALPGVSQNLKKEVYTQLPVGSVMPSGWLKVQMEKDMAGFVGHLDQLVPELINDPIYSSGRLQKHSKVKELGNLKSGDAEGDEQYMWWNSETQSNWWDGYIRNAILLGNREAIGRAKSYVYNVLATQDLDGYIGIYGEDQRYKFTTENGELWSKTTMYRGLLAYYEYSHDQNVWHALVRAVDNVMLNYPINASEPFFAGKDFSGGVAHGLTFTDILDRMYQLTGDRKYWDYAGFLYMNFSKNYSSEKDAQLANILDPTFKLQSHGVHTYEHLRPLIVAEYVLGSPDLSQALDVFLARVRNATTVTGGAIGDEWIAEREADETHTGYEYCSLHELMNSYAVLMQKSGSIRAAEEVENIFFNAAQGSRDPNHSAIAYLKTDNSYEMLGTKNGEEEPNRVQTRYKYSPVHQDVAVCCAPNAGRISPYFVQYSWLKQDEKTLVASLLCPSVVETNIDGNHVRIEEITDYPYNNRFQMKMELGKAQWLKIKIRIPEWATSIITSEKYSVENGFVVVNRNFAVSDMVELEFLTKVIVRENQNHEHYFSYGALVFAKPSGAAEIKGREYATDFYDYTYAATDTVRYAFLSNHEATYINGAIEVTLKNTLTQKPERVLLVPVGKTVLRQVSFRE